MKWTIYLCVVLCCGAIGCSSQVIQRPSIQRFTPSYTPSQKGRIAHHSSAPNVDIFDLRPDENSVLFDGRSYEASIDVAMTADVSLDTEYLVEAIFSNVSSGHFSLREIIQGAGNVDFYARLMWSVPANGNDERIQVNLYRVLHSNTGNTTFTIRDKSILRQYEVRCDPEGFFILHFLRRVLGACHD